MVLLTMETPQLRVETVVDSLVAGRAVPCRDAGFSHGPDCCWTTEFPQFTDTVDDVLVVQTCRFSRAGPGSSFLIVTLLAMEIPQLQLVGFFGQCR